MTDNERLFGPMRRAQLEPIEDAEALVRAINSPPLLLGDVAIAAFDERTVRIYSGLSEPGRAVVDRALMRRAGMA